MSTSTDIGYEGQSPTIRCPDYTPPGTSEGVTFVWKKSKHEQFEVVATYTRLSTGEELGPNYYDDLGNGRASLSTSNGDLTITSLQLSPINDEASYKCDFLCYSKGVSVQVNGKFTILDFYSCFIF